MNAWRLKYRNLREAVEALFEQLPMEPNATSAGYGKERGEQYYLRRLSTASVKRVREVMNA